MKASTPTILHLSGRSFWCGESNRILVICSGLRAAGWAVTLGVPPNSPLAMRAREAGIPVDTHFRFRRGLRPFAMMRDVLALRRLHRESPIDVIHVHTSVDTWVAALAFGFSRRPPCPLVVRTRHSDHVCKRDIMHRWLYRRTIDHVVLSSGSLRVPLAGLFRTGALSEERVSVIHSSVNVDRFDPARVSGTAIRTALKLDGKFCIGLVGRISCEKGHEQMLNILPELVRAEPRIVCVFAGEGDREDRLRAQAEKGPMREHVRFTGFRSDIPEIMAAMDLLVVPSTRVESSPGVVKEGMSMEKPVLAADVGGVAEIIRHGEDGWVVPLKDEGLLRDAILHLVQHPDLCTRLGVAGRARVVSGFSDARLVSKTMQLYLVLRG